MKRTLKNRKKKTTTHFSTSVLKKKNIVEEGGTLGSRVKREHESTNLRAQKMMRDRVEPFAILIVVKVVPQVVHVVRQTAAIPRMTSP
jgi:hypothetical protein